MAVHVLLSRDEVRSILSLYHLDELEDFGGIPEGSINTSYWVRVAGRRYFLRITERKRVQDMVFERSLLDQLKASGLPVPSLIPNVAQGTFTPWSTRGRFVSLFEYLEGRELGLFEVRPPHIRAVARFAARMHLATQGFGRTRKNNFDLPVLGEKLSRLHRALDGRRLARRFAADVDTLSEELARQSRRRFDHLPRGTVHGDLFVDNTKFKDGKLSGVIDFELSSSERLVWELAVALNAWCWEPDADQKGGPSGAFNLVKTRALLLGYAGEREPSKPERAALAADLRLAAARFAITRLVDYELTRPARGRQGYKDYRHFMQRLTALGSGGAEAIVEDALG